ncbi:MAG: RNA degradosome polyphosphate kinase [Propionibacteriaceae bacterium]|nr:RNA degradosome polyphosphate kinase [Propionibacteriaceae bacterium]
MIKEDEASAREKWAEQAGPVVFRDSDDTVTSASPAQREPASVSDDLDEADSAPTQESDIADDAGLPEDAEAYADEVQAPEGQEPDAVTGETWDDESPVDEGADNAAQFKDWDEPDDTLEELSPEPAPAVELGAWDFLDDFTRRLEAEKAAIQAAAVTVPPEPEFPWTEEVTPAQDDAEELVAEDEPEPAQDEEAEEPSDETDFEDTSETPLPAESDTVAQDAQIVLVEEISSDTAEATSDGEPQPEADIQDQTEPAEQAQPEANPVAESATDEEVVAPEDLPLPENRYSDRELSWLAFNNRVLDLARDKQRIPLLERAKFLAIFSSNLDEFFMVRVAGLKRRIDAGMAQPGTSGLLPRELHEVMLSTARDLVAEQSRVFVEEVQPELAEKGILVVRWPDLTEAEKVRLDELFNDRIFPILTPLAVDPSHPFPYISGLSLNLAVQLRNPASDTPLFARIKVPNVLPRFLEISASRFVPLEDVISNHLDTIFTGMEILHSTTFRVTRNEDVEVEEDDAENILFALEKELLRRKVGRSPVRLEVQEGIDPELLTTLAEELDISTSEIFHIRGPLDLTGLFSIADVDREDLKYPSFLPKTNPQLSEVETSRPADMFAALKQRDVLLHHPYDSFATSVQRFIEQAAADQQVLAIKLTLYRTSGDSPIVDALIEAARAGKQVLALVEIKARFDESANIAWARKLEKAGVHVVYGLVGLKTHCKLAMVIRDEGDSLRRYCHIGTGNYNPKTARQYEDMGLLTSNPVITEDVARLFNHLSGLTAQSKYARLLVSPFGIRNGLIEQIEHEIELQKSGTPGRIRFKVNSIVDEATMDALYRASQAGVKVDLWVRGICALRGGVPGLSENIRVRSILGRFLEHSRLFWFDNAGSPIVGIGSADLMHRNLDRRVEVVVRLSNEAHIAQVGSLFDMAFDEATASWWMTEDGWVQKTTAEDGTALTDLQEHLIHLMGTRRPIAI